VNTTRNDSNWIQTAHGRVFYPTDPRPEEVFLDDIAFALSNETRFGGHVRKYSVAQHSCLVADHLPYHLAAQGLLHDATEAYLKDIPRPIKKYLIGYDLLESQMAQCIGRAFGLVLDPLPSEVHEHDGRALVTEKRDLIPQQPKDWHLSFAPWTEKIVVWEPEQAEHEFLVRARSLYIHKVR
jgi:hypothetical protein